MSNITTNLNPLIVVLQISENFGTQEIGHMNLSTFMKIHSIDQDQALLASSVIYFGSVNNMILSQNEQATRFADYEAEGLPKPPGLAIKLSEHHFDAMMADYMNEVA